MKDVKKQETELFLLDEIFLGFELFSLLSLFSHLKEEK